MPVDLKKLVTAWRFAGAIQTSLTYGRICFELSRVRISSGGTMRRLGTQLNLGDHSVRQAHAAGPQHCLLPSLSVINESPRAVVLNVWVVTPTGVTCQIFKLQFITIAKLYLWSSSKIVFWSGVTAAWGTVLKDLSIWKVENHCDRGRHSQWGCKDLWIASDKNGTGRQPSNSL